MTEKRFVVFVPKQTGRDDFRLVDSCDRLLHNNKTEKFHKLTYVSIRSISETATRRISNYCGYFALIFCFECIIVTDLRNEDF